MKKFFSIVFFILASVFSFAQTATVNGIIVDKNGTAQPWLAVALKGTKINTIADSLGFFQFKNVSYGNYIIIVYQEPQPVEQKITVQHTQEQIKIVVNESKKDLGEVVVISSSRTNSRIEDLPTKVEVLGAEEVAEENQIKPGNIASLLGDIAGIQIQPTNAATGNADMRIQGLQGKYTQILRDGMPLFGGYSGSFGILQIPPLDLQQIELVKGSSSTLYGGGAIAGMLNLVSKKPKLGSPEHSVTINSSTLQENNLNLFLSERNKTNGYTFFAGGTYQNNVDVNKDGFSDVPKTQSAFIHPKWFHYFNPKSTISVGYTFNYEDRNGGDMNVINNHADATHQFYIKNKSLRNTVDVVYENKISTTASFTTKACYNFFNRDINTNLFGMKAIQNLWYSEVAYSQKLKKHQLVTGINFNGDDFKKKNPDSTLLPNEQTNTVGFFIQDDWRIHPKFTLQAGFRTDIHSVYGTFVLPRISMMYKPSNSITMRLGGGLGYKTPTLINSDLDEREYRFITGYQVGIRAEKSVGLNFDINYKKKIEEWEITFNNTLFYNQVSKPISLYYNFTTGFLPITSTYYNENKALQTTGFETYLAAKQDELELYLGYVYTNALRKYNTTNTHLPLIAKHKLATVVAYELSEKWRAGIEAAYTGNQYLDDGSKSKDYVFAAAMVRYSIKKWSFVFNCENLFDFRQNKNNQIVFPPYNNPSFSEIWAPLDGRVINLSIMLKW